MLVEEPGARPARGYTGLYHFALLVPRAAPTSRAGSRTPRATACRWSGCPTTSSARRSTCSDPDGHGIEIYWDRPREHWEGQVAARMTTLPLDVDELLGELDDPAAAPFDGLPAGTVDGPRAPEGGRRSPETVAFYRDVLGFGLMAQLGAQAAFLAAGGYHHHIGANTWESAGAPPPPAGTAALRHATIVLPDAAERERLLARLDAGGHAVTDSEHGPTVDDPSGNTLVLVPAG